MKRKRLDPIILVIGRVLYLAHTNHGGPPRLATRKGAK